MSTDQITLDAACYRQMEETLAALHQRVAELEHAERDRKQTETSLRQSEDLFRTTFEQAPVGITFATLRGRYTQFNQCWVDIVGYNEDELLELTFQDITHPEDLELELDYREQLLQGEIASYSIEKRYVCNNRSVVWVHFTASLMRSPDGTPRYIVGVVQDINDRKTAETERALAETQLQQKAHDLENALNELRQTQSQLVQSEKMSSLGQLVAGVAHEINNPVNFIYGNLNYANDYIQDLLGLLQLYQQCYSPPHEVIQEAIETIDLDFLIEDLPKLLSSMRIGAERIREIIASLRNFSRLDEAEFKTVDLHEGIDSTLMILQNRIKAKPKHSAIEVIKFYGDLPTVQCYPGQLNQVFMNILTNAIDALEEKMERQDAIAETPFVPTITIQTEVLSLQRVCIKIMDNGPGIPPEVQQRLFDPFFTTKAVGKGTGLGMSISYQIITERHNGSLQCNSQVGAGATFRIEIPTRQSVPD